MMKTYRLRPVEIQAAQWKVTHTPSDSAKPIVDYINANGGKAYFLYDHDAELRFAPSIVIETSNGPLKAHPGYYIIQRSVGDFWSLSPDIFEKNHELVLDPISDPKTPVQVGTE